MENNKSGHASVILWQLNAIKHDYKGVANEEELAFIEDLKRCKKYKL